jgi:hypothetical protein
VDGILKKKLFLPFNNIAQSSLLKLHTVGQTDERYFVHANRSADLR